MPTLNDLERPGRREGSPCAHLAGEWKAGRR